MTPLCSVEVARVGTSAVVTLRGEVDLSNVADVEAQVVECTNGDTHALVIDLTHLGYIDSSGFGMLERVSRKTQLRLAIAPTAVIHRALVVTGLAQLVPMFPTVDEALAAG